MRPRASLVRRLIWLAAVWIMAALIAAGVALNVFYRQTTVRRFEAGISEINDTLLASAFIGRDNAVHVPLAPANDKDRGDAPPRTLVDAAANRVGSGRYWEIAEPVSATPGEVARSIRPRARSRMRAARARGATRSAPSTRPCEQCVASRPGSPPSALDTSPVPPGDAGQRSMRAMARGRIPLEAPREVSSRGSDPNLGGTIAPARSVSIPLGSTFGRQLMA